MLEAGRGRDAAAIANLKAPQGRIASSFSPTDSQAAVPWTKALSGQVVRWSGSLRAGQTTTPLPVAAPLNSDDDADGDGGAAEEVVAPPPILSPQICTRAFGSQQTSPGLNPA